MVSDSDAPKRQHGTQQPTLKGLWWGGDILLQELELSELTSERWPLPMPEVEMGGFLPHKVCKGLLFPLLRQKGKMHR